MCKEYGSTTRQTQYVIKRNYYVEILFRRNNYAFITYYVCWDWTTKMLFNTLRPRQNDRHFADDIFKRIFFNENVWISIQISLKFVPKGPINIIPAMFQIMAWRRPGDKPLSEAMLVCLLTHIYASLGLNKLRCKNKTNCEVLSHLALWLNRLSCDITQAPGTVTSYWSVVLASPN